MKRDDIRPTFHFTPAKGWMNDPNGMIYIDGVYHLFYQHYPNDIVWGPMHWGHATSKDLYTWTHHDIALFPDESGYAFSGSAIYDVDNVSLLGTKDEPALILMYTSHNPKTGEQQQCIAYSQDFEHFTKYENNPVIANCMLDSNYQKEYRDPKLFVNEVLGGYSMALAVDSVIEFYHSFNLTDWKKTGVFDPGKNGFSGMCECPDCIKLSYEDGYKWVLLVSMVLKDADVGKDILEGGYTQPRVMQYFVGEFDGYTFNDTQQCNHPLVLDYGTDNYAMVSFMDDKDHVLLGWGEHWDYVRDIPATTWKGKMTIPRIPRLVNTKDGCRLAQRPYAGLPQSSIERYHVEVGQAVTIGNGTDLFSIYLDDDCIYVDRRGCVDVDNCECLKKDSYNICSASRYTTGACDIEVVKDANYFEIFAEEGLLTFSVMTYPKHPV